MNLVIESIGDSSGCYDRTSEVKLIYSFDQLGFIYIFLSVEC